MLFVVLAKRIALKSAIKEFFDELTSDVVGLWILEALINYFRRDLQ